MTRRQWRWVCSELPRLLFTWWYEIPLRCLRAAAVARRQRQRRCGALDGIAFSNFADLTPREVALFVLRTEQVLYWIRQDAPACYRRIRRHVRHITNKVSVEGGTWCVDERTVFIDFSRFRGALADEASEDYGAWLLAYAGALVHEATHARLDAAGFPYNEETWRRIESICFREENRCIVRLGNYPETDEIRAWVKEVDLSWHEAYRARSPLERFRQWRARRREGP